MSRAGPRSLSTEPAERSLSSVAQGFWPCEQPRSAASSDAAKYRLVVAIEAAVDVRVADFAPLGFRHAVTRGRLLLAHDLEAWFTFRERTWTEYFDFAPVAREALADLLGPGS